MKRWGKSRRASKDGTAASRDADVPNGGNIGNIGTTNATNSPGTNNSGFSTILRRASRLSMSDALLSAPNSAPSTPPAQSKRYSAHVVPRPTTPARHVFASSESLIEDDESTRSARSARSGRSSRAATTLYSVSVNAESQTDFEPILSLSRHGTNVTNTTDSNLTALSSISTTPQNFTLPDIDFSHINNFDATIFRSGWLNRASAVFSTWGGCSAAESCTWTLYCAVLRGLELSLYRVPSSIGARNFDPRSPSRETTQLTNNKQISASTEPIDPASASGSVTASGRSEPVTTSVVVTEPTFPHPQLRISADGAIVESGSAEAVAHTIVAYPAEDTQLVRRLILLIPLLFDVAQVINYIAEYAVLFRASELSVTRAALVIDTFVEQMRGILLENPVLAALLRLAEAVSPLDDATASRLKVALSRAVPSVPESFSPPSKFVAAEEGNLLPQTRELITELTTTTPHKLQILPWQILENIPIRLFATQISYFHLAYLSAWSPRHDVSLLYGTELPYRTRNPLAAVSGCRHFLSRAVLDHVLAPNPAERRAEVLARWISIGREFETLGDLVGWLAVAVAVCNPSILRLKKCWSLVPSELREAVRTEWAPVVYDVERREAEAEAGTEAETEAETETETETGTRMSQTSNSSTSVSAYHVLTQKGIGTTYPKEFVIPYFGDLTIYKKTGNSIADYDKQLSRLLLAFNRWDAFINQINNTESVEDFKVSPELPQLQLLLRQLHENAAAAPPRDPNADMRQSLTAEPVLLGNFAPLHATARTPLVLGNYLPIVFTDLLPALHVFSKPELIAASGVDALLDDTETRGTEHDKVSARTKTHRNSFVFPNSKKNLRQAEIVATTKTERSLSESAAEGGNGSGSGSPDSGKLEFPLPTPLPELAVENNVGSSTKTNNLGTATRPVSRNRFLKTIRDMLNVGAEVYSGDGIVLKSVPDSDELRSSRPASVVFESLSARRLSSYTEADVTETSIESMSQSMTQSVTVVVQAATPARLVDLLVADVAVIGTDVKPAIGTTKEFAPQFTMDAAAFETTFFTTFRSVLTPRELLAMLVERHKHPETVHGVPASAVRLGVVRVLRHWVDGWFTDFADSLTLRQQLLQFVAETETGTEAGADDVTDSGYTEALQALRVQTLKRCYRPVEIYPAPPAWASLTSVTSVTSNSDMSSLSLPDAGSVPALSSFLSTLDAFVAAYFRRLSPMDCEAVYEALQQKSAAALGLFDYTPASNVGSPNDIVAVTDVFQWLSTVKAVNTNLGSGTDTGDRRLEAQLPPPFRALVALHGAVTGFFLRQITAAGLSRQERVKRMLAILRLLGIARKRMSVPEGSNVAVPPIPSFVETAMAAAIARPESRRFGNSWTLACTLLGVADPTRLAAVAEAVTAEIGPNLPENLGPLTPCIGWFTERLLEIVCYVPNMAPSHSELVNFDKLRYVHNCIANYLDMCQIGDTNGESEPGTETGTELESTNLTPAQFRFLLTETGPELSEEEREVAKKTAEAEAAAYGSLGAGPAVFASDIATEEIKLRRDYKQKTALIRQRREALKGGRAAPGTALATVLSNANAAAASASSPASSSASTTTNSSITREAPPSPTPTVSSNSGFHKRGSKFAKFFRPFRPSAWNPTGSTDRTILASELPDNSTFLSTILSQKVKPICVINISEAQISPIVSSEFPALWKLVGKDGTDITLQSPSASERRAWLHVLAQVKKHRYLSESSGASARSFGVPLSALCARDGTPVPRVVETLLGEIELRGLDETGLYRVSGSVGSVTALKAAFDSGGSVSMEDDRWFDINTVASCFKLFLRELPEPLLPDPLFAEFLSTMSENNVNKSRDIRIGQLKQIVAQLPEPNLALLKRLMRHLNRVAQHSTRNKMDAHNLAVVFSMSFARDGGVARVAQGGNVALEFELVNALVLEMIVNCEEIFGTEAETGVEAEAEGLGNAEVTGTGTGTDAASEAASALSIPTLDPRINGPAGHSRTESLAPSVAESVAESLVESLTEALAEVGLVEGTKAEAEAEVETGTEL